MSVGVRVGVLVDVTVALPVGKNDVNDGTTVKVGLAVKADVGESVGIGILVAMLG